MSEWTYSNNHQIVKDYNDDNIVMINRNKMIDPLINHPVVSGEANAQYIPFETDRFIQGIDLIEMMFYISFNMPDGKNGESLCVNLHYNADKIRFGWIVPDTALYMAGKINVTVWATGQVNSNGYIWKTQPVCYEVLRGEVIGSGEISRTESWYIDFVQQLSNKIEIYHNTANELNDLLPLLEEKTPIINNLNTLGNEIIDTINGTIVEAEKIKEELEELILQGQNLFDDPENIPHHVATVSNLVITTSKSGATKQMVATGNISLAMPINQFLFFVSDAFAPKFGTIVKNIFTQTLRVDISISTDGSVMYRGARDLQTNALVQTLPANTINDGFNFMYI